VLDLTTFVPHCLNCNVPLLRRHQNCCILRLVLRVAVARCVWVLDRASTIRGDLEISSGEDSVARDTRVRLDALFPVSLCSTSCCRGGEGPRTVIESHFHHYKCVGSNGMFTDMM